MAGSSRTFDPLERVLAAVQEEYRSRIDADALGKAVDLAREQAVHLRLENRPMLVETALRDYLDSLWWRRMRSRTGEGSGRSRQSSSAGV